VYAFLRERGLTEFPLLIRTAISSGLHTVINM